MGARMRRTRRGAAALAAVVVSLLAAPTAQGEYSVRVDPNYFGVNYPLFHFDSPGVREAQLAAISQAGIGTVRIALSWAALEPEAPTGTHNYNFEPSDEIVGALAAHRLRLAPTFIYTPTWAASGSAITCSGQAVSLATVRPGDYAAAAAALARRYGPNGSFWSANPNLPKMAINTWQIWNEPNLRTYWCPNPDPPAYAELFSQAATAIHNVDRDARVVTAGMVLADRTGAYMSAADFWRGMGRPDVWSQADGIGFHVFPGGTINRQFDQFAQVRDYVSAAGAPKTLPLYGTEVGWGLGPINEQQRAERYDYVTERISSTNCNVGVMYAHAWTTSPPGGIVYDQDSGIADRTTGALFPSAVAYRNAIRILEGRGDREAKHENLKHCDDMPKLDRDRDNRAEHRDYYPFDPRRWKGPPGWYDGIKFNARRKQKLGKPIVVNAICDENCRVTVSGRIQLAQVKGKKSLKLKKVRVKAKGGKPKEILLKPTAKARKRIRGTSATKGKAKVKGFSIIEDERFDADGFKVKLRRKR
ncbi:MAG TPA: hypothetical protein VHF58_05080 [Solirubrobacterales bacterium]|nr:hypothetical protein [Solirubrobacterales bacterium]